MLVWGYEGLTLTAIRSDKASLIIELPLRGQSCEQSMTIVTINSTITINVIIVTTTIITSTINTVLSPSPSSRHQHPLSIVFKGFGAQDKWKAILNTPKSS
jgi:hypothetical protein